METYQANNGLKLAPTMPLPLFRGLLLLAIISFSAIWFVDSSSGIIVSFDAAAYPVCINCFLLILGASFVLKRGINVLHFLTYGVIAGYLIASSTYHHLVDNALFSNSAQWLGLNYVIAYLFLDVKKAGPTTIIVFCITLISHFFALLQHYSITDIYGVLANIAIANLIYMVLLWTVLRMRVDSNKITQKALSLQEYALYDPLTKVRNRRGLEKQLEDAESKWQRKLQRYSILMIDIDHFKQVNDMHGHLMGDRILSDIAAVLNKQVSSKGVLARWGGEEFIALIKDISQQQVLELAEHIRLAVLNMEFEHQAIMSVSIGISHSEEASDHIAVLGVADYNLYSAKHSGRNKVMDSTLASQLTRTPSPHEDHLA